MYENIATYLLSSTSFRPTVGIICGSGLSNLSEGIENSITFNYEDIPGFPQATVPGHKGIHIMYIIHKCCREISMQWNISVLNRSVIYNPTESLRHQESIYDLM